MSEHPLAAAIVAGALERNLSLSNREFQSTTGHGVSAIVDGHTVSIGRAPSPRYANVPRN